MADGEVKINTTLDTSGVDGGIKELKDKLGTLGNVTEKTEEQTEQLNDAIEDTGAKAETAGKKVETHGKKVENVGKKNKAAGDSTKKLGIILNEASGSAGGFASKLQSVASSGGMYVAAAVAAITAIKKLTESMKECSEKYRIQERAEKALAAAANNNPYLDDQAVNNFKNYASELQKVTNYGDELSISVMTQLAAAGRSEEQIIKIMGAAADMAAATGQSLEGAAKQISKTFSGTAGELGEVSLEIRNLSAEELKNGKAVDVVANQYKGIATSMADTKTQVANLKGDFQEALGELMRPAEGGWDNFWKGFYEDGIAMVNALSNQLDEWSRTWSFGGKRRWTDDGIETIINTYTNKKTGKEYNGAHFQSDQYLEDMLKELQFREEREGLTSNEETALIYVMDELRLRKELAKQKKEEEETEKRLLEIEKQKAAAKQKLDDFARSSNESLEQQLNRMELEADLTGKAVDPQQKYNAILQNYIALLTDTENKIEKGYPIEVRRRKELEEAKRALDEATEAEDKLNASIELTNKALEFMNSTGGAEATDEVLRGQIANYSDLRNKIADMSEEEVAAAQKGNKEIYSKQQLLENLKNAEVQTESATIDARLDLQKSYYDKFAEQQQQLLELKKAVDESEVLSEEEKEKKKQEIDKAYTSKRLELMNSVLSEINDYSQRSNEIIQNAASMALETENNRMSAELDNLEIKYRKGEIGEEEYQKKVAEAKKKGARMQYQIELAQWASNLMTATANIAVGVTQAIAQGGVAGIITGALVGAAGAVQLASIAAAKPIQHFASGGFVGGMSGASMGADNSVAAVRTGEYIMNAQQQRYLWDFLNGKNSAGSGWNVTINNSAANLVNAEPRISPGRIELMIDARVNDSLRKGRYNNGLNAAQASMSGEFYGM